MHTDTIVMKFGGAAVSSPERFSRIAEIIISRRATYPKIVAVLSAMGDTTDQLIALAKRVHPSPPQREYDMLITVGERISISLLAMALSLNDQSAISYTGSQSGIITTDRHTEARIIDVTPIRLIDSLNKGQIVIVAGFQGVSRGGEITTLGRGGSDTTAVALASALRAEKVEFYKDVNGVYDCDPKLKANARLFPRLTYDQAKVIVSKGAKVLHDRSLELAERNQIPLHIRSFLDDSFPGTIIVGEPLARTAPLYEMMEAG